jgi:UDP-GlcNAc:undecaprenyl-phosphate GlcNAc-1-phosphate transferase
MKFTPEDYFAIFFLCVFLSSALIPTLKRIAFKLDIVDYPNQSHKTHTEGVPYLGGLAIVIPVTVVASFLPFLYEPLRVYAVNSALLVIPALFLAVVGLIDDIKNLSAISRLVSQLVTSTAVAIVLINLGYSVSISGNFLGDFFISILWMVGITNSLNFIDNLDGGAAGVSAIASLLIFVLAVMSGQFLIAGFGLAISATCIGFLFWNHNPASIYLGDCGALFLGMILSVLILQYEPESSSAFASILTPIAVMAIPLMDASVVISSRLLRRISPLQGGKDHLSHRLVFLGFSKQKSASILWSMSAFFALQSVLLQRLNGQVLEYFSILLLAILVITFLYFLRLDRRLFSI